MELTEKQSQIYEFIRGKIADGELTPTFREIMKEFNIGSPNGVTCHLKALEKKGVITRKRGLSRSIQIVRSPITTH